MGPGVTLYLNGASSAGILGQNVDTMGVVSTSRMRLIPSVGATGPSGSACLWLGFSPPALAFGGGQTAGLLAGFIPLSCAVVGDASGCAEVCLACFSSKGRVPSLLFVVSEAGSASLGV